MSVLIKGMEMPTTSRQCPFREMTGDWILRCTVGGTYVWRNDGLCFDCPLIPVPEHGRLIDADALSEMLEKYKKNYALKAEEDITLLHKAWGLHDAELMAESLPTIIPADRADKEGEG